MFVVVALDAALKLGVTPDQQGTPCIGVSPVETQAAGQEGIGAMSQVIEKDA